MTQPRAVWRRAEGRDAARRPRHARGGFRPSARARSRALDRAGIEEAEVVAPADVARDLARARLLPRGAICLSGLVYATAAGVEDEVARCAEVLDRVDLLMPLSRHRPPAAPAAKIRQLTSALRRARRCRNRSWAPGSRIPSRPMIACCSTIARAAADARRPPAHVIRHERRCGALRAARSRGGGGRRYRAADLLSRARRPWPRHRECLGGRAGRCVRPRRDSEWSRRSGGQREPGTGGAAPACTCAGPAGMRLEALPAPVAPRCA